MAAGLGGPATAPAIAVSSNARPQTPQRCSAPWAHGADQPWQGAHSALPAPRRRANADPPAAAQETVMAIKRFSADDVQLIAKDRVFQGYFAIDRYRVRHRTFDGGWTGEITRELFERG